MEPKPRKYLIGLFCAIVAMFLLIFVAVGLTGGREVEEFTDTDKIIMTVFAVVEITIMIGTFWFAVRYGNEQGKRFRHQLHTVEANRAQKTDRRGTALLALAFTAALGAMIGGIVLGEALSEQLRDLSGWLLGISLAVAAASLLLNIVLEKWYAGRFNNRQVSQVYQYVYSHREHAQRKAQEKLTLLKRWRFFTGAYGVLLGVLGLCVALCGGILLDTGSAVALCFAASILIMCAFSRIRFRVSQDVFDEDKSYVSEEQYPHLYALAEKAARTVGCHGSIKIALLTGCNAGIAKVGQAYSVQLGVILLCSLSEEEMYCVLLHEFAHMTADNSETIKAGNYHTWIYGGKTPHFLSGLTNLFFSFFDGFYALQFALYAYAAAIGTESAADQAMLLSNDPEAVASALLKLKYYELFDWEKGTQDEPCRYESETPDPQVLARELERFRQAMEQKSGKWQQLVDAEIQSRSASHPTLKLRLEALGIREPHLLAAPADCDYAKECEKAREYVENLICGKLSQSFEERRKERYWKLKAQVEAWEEAGKPVVAEEYGDILWALRQLGRNTEAFALCERAIEELPAAASCDGYFIRGCYRLHSYDERGIEDIYFAIENNSNYLEEGIDTIGTFCCLTGNQKELDIYRQKALELAQKQKDEYSQVSVLTKKDRLSEESLPEGMLDDILAYIRSVDEGQIEKIYLVRKTITEDFFTSVFVIRFDLAAEETACEQILHKIFRYLDTCSDWQFSLFDYQEVMSVPVYAVKNSCVYSKEN